MKAKKIIASVLCAAVVTAAMSSSVFADWDKSGDKIYYTEDGKKITGFREIDGEWYYFKSADGSMATGRMKIGGEYYYFNKDGKMLRGKSYKIGDATYTFAADGKQLGNPLYKAPKSDYDIPEKDTGDTLTVYGNNTEFEDIINYYLSDNPLPDGVEIKYVIVSSVDGDYQRVLESKLKKGEDVDIFVTEAIWSDLVREYALPLNELGLKNSDLADYYRSSYQVSSDKYGRVLGLSPYTNNGVLIYRRSIAKDVLGTDDPTKVAAYVKNMKTFNNTAKKISDAGYTVTGAPGDLFRLYNSGNETPAVKNGKVTIPAAWKEWADYAKKTYANDYYRADNVWAEEWYGGMRDTGETFCYFGPSWFVDYTIGPNSGNGYSNNDQSNDWAVTTPPAGYVWGPVTLSIAGSSDNPHLAYDIIKTLSGDETIQKNLAIEELFMPNLKSVTKELAASDFSHNYLGGQNPYEIFHKAGLAVDINPENLWYTEKLSPLYSTAMTDYITGYISYEEALKNFKEDVKKEYPKLKF